MHFAEQTQRSHRETWLSGGRMQDPDVCYWPGQRSERCSRPACQTPELGGRIVLVALSAGDAPKL